MNNVLHPVFNNLGQVIIFLPCNDLNSFEFNMSNSELCVDQFKTSRWPCENCVRLSISHKGILTVSVHLTFGKRTYMYFKFPGFVG